jgi:2-polyprenyl-6-methoxyphenol hydroxylase-like FAD-dependent oxidoreductase
MGSISGPPSYDAHDANGSNGVSGTATAFYQQAQTPLQVIIVGAGLGGLSLAYVLGRSGHTIVVLEAASVIKEVWSHYAFSGLFLIFDTFDLGWRGDQLHPELDPTARSLGDRVLHRKGHHVSQENRTSAMAERGVPGRRNLDA